MYRNDARQRTASRDEGRNRLVRGRLENTVRTLRRLLEIGVVIERHADWETPLIYRSNLRKAGRLVRPSAFVVGLFVLTAMLFAAGCSSNLTLQKMGTQPRYDPLAPSDFFADGQSARPPVPGSFARGHTEDDALLFTGKIGNQDANVFPFTITRDVLARGQDRFNIYCSPCHGQTGGGNGMIVQRGFTAPPTFHQDRLRTAPIGHFFDVITNGFGAMPSYASQIPAQDRWAIIAFIRALQLSQHATINDVPPDQRDQLGTPP